MKKIILLFPFLLIYFAAYNQVISGTVIDRKTNEKISFAAIYFNGTFVGTTSDVNGNFQLDVTKNVSMPLSVNCMGYESVTLADYLEMNPLIIYLEPRFIEVNEVVVSGTSLVRRKRANMKLFKSYFLGTTENALRCEIVNEEDITFNYGSDNDTLKAFAANPIIIINKLLGYKISYYLDKFEYDKKNHTFLYIGNMIFTEDFSTDNTKGETYLTNRRNTYIGSRMHFIRSLWANELNVSGFEIRTPENEVLKYENIVTLEIVYSQDSRITSKKYIRYPEPLQINYRGVTSRLVPRKSKIYFDETGYVELGLSWEGAMAAKRIADTLPYDYLP